MHLSFHEMEKIILVNLTLKLHFWLKKYISRLSPSHSREDKKKRKQTEERKKHFPTLSLSRTGQKKENRTKKERKLPHSLGHIPLFAHFTQHTHTLFRHKEAAAGWTKSLELPQNFSQGITTSLRYFFQLFLF